MTRGPIKRVLPASLIALWLPTMAWAYEPVFEATNPANMGSVPALHDGNGIPSTMTRWKSARVRAAVSGTATHFVIRVGSDNVGSVPVGFAVYSGTSGQRDPIGALLIRGYHASFDFTTSGYYALPFTSAESMEVAAGHYYHLVYLLTPGNEAAASGWRIANDPTPPPKWFSDCSKAACNANEPPGVGGEFWNGQYWPTSAGWAMGLLDRSGGVPSDGGSPVDSAVPSDSTTQSDSATPADSAIQGDSFVTLDSSSPDDATVAPDGTAPRDVGALSDSADPGEGGSDGAAASDAQQPDGGPGPEPSTGCGCRAASAGAAPAPACIVLAGVLLALLRVRRGR